MVSRNSQASTGTNGSNDEEITIVPPFFKMETGSDNNGEKACNAPRPDLCTLFGLLF
jgi:hypothetical protein